MKMTIKTNADVYNLNTEFIEIHYLNEYGKDVFKKIYFSDGVSVVYITNPSKGGLHIKPKNFNILNAVKLNMCDIAYRTQCKNIQYSKTSNMKVERNFVSTLFVILDDHDYDLVMDHLASQLIKKETVL